MVVSQHASNGFLNSFISTGDGQGPGLSSNPQLAHPRVDKEKKPETQGSRVGSTEEAAATPW